MSKATIGSRKKRGSGPPRDIVFGLLTRDTVLTVTKR